MKKIPFREIYDAFLFVSLEDYGMNSVILCKDTGEMYYHSEDGVIDEVDDEEFDCDDFLKIPHKNDFGLGRELVYEFADQYLADDVNRVQTIFQSRGAYRRFKDLLEQRKMLQKWYDFKYLREEKALRQWCVDNDILLAEENLSASEC